MSSRHLLFGLRYRLDFTPWDGHPLTQSLRDKVDVNFVQADVTRLSTEGVGKDFGFIVDNGCLHGMSDEDRDAYVREVTAVAAPDARLLLVEFVNGGSYGVPGIDPQDVRRRFRPRGRCWTRATSRGWTTTAEIRCATTCLRGRRAQPHPAG